MHPHSAAVTAHTDIRGASPEPAVLLPDAFPPLSALVTTASAHGATRDIGRTIAATLRASGVDATMIDIADVKDLTPYDVVVLGSAIHTHHWLAEAEQFVDRHQEALRQRSVWLFSSGMLTLDSGEPWAAGYPEGITRLLAVTGAHGHRVFAGRRDFPRPGALWNLLGKGMVRYAVWKGLAREGYVLTAGDFRDWDAIREWARGIAASLRGDANHRAA